MTHFIIFISFSPEKHSVDEHLSALIHKVSNVASAHFESVTFLFRKMQI